MPQRRHDKAMATGGVELNRSHLRWLQAIRLLRAYSEGKLRLPDRKRILCAFLFVSQKGQKQPSNHKTMFGILLGSNIVRWITTTVRMAEELAYKDEAAAGYDRAFAHVTMGAGNANPTAHARFGPFADSPL